MDCRNISPLYANLRELLFKINLDTNRLLRDPFCRIESAISNLFGRRRDVAILEVVVGSQLASGSRRLSFVFGVKLDVYGDYAPLRMQMDSEVVLRMSRFLNVWL